MVSTVQRGHPQNIADSSRHPQSWHLHPEDEGCHWRLVWWRQRLFIPSGWSRVCEFNKILENSDNKGNKSKNLSDIQNIGRHLYVNLNTVSKIQYVSSHPLQHGGWKFQSERSWRWARGLEGHKQADRFIWEKNRGGRICLQYTSLMKSLHWSYCAGRLHSDSGAALTATQWVMRKPHQEEWLHLPGL